MQTTIMRMLSCLFCLVLVTEAFVTLPKRSIRTLSLQQQSQDSNVKSSSNARKRPQQSERLTLAELREKMLQNPSKYQADIDKAAAKPKKTTSSKYRRTRQRAANPQQTYVYAAQRKQQDEEEAPKVVTTNEARTLAAEWGLKMTAQYCDVLVSDAEQPAILGQVRVSDDAGSGAYAYMVSKPAGWAILGGSSEKKKNIKGKKSKSRDDELDNVVEDEFNDDDILALLSPEEREEYLTEIEQNVGASTSASDDTLSDSDVSPSTMENLRRIKIRSEIATQRAVFAETLRPSIVSWLKQYKANEENTTIRGGNYWTAVAGATSVDDSGIVLLCPKDYVKNLFVDQTEFISVVGTGGCLATASTPTGLTENVKVDLSSRVRKGREDDVIHTLKLIVSETACTCSDLVDTCQKQLQNGVRGDPAANPLDRRARRRLMHCHAMSVSSLTHDDSGSVQMDSLPDDIAILADRRNNFRYKSGSFLGRESLRLNGLTNCYREISGASDGYPGWIVDRYDKWLLVQHDIAAAPEKGPLPSIHDGNTAGVYYIQSHQDRNAMGNNASDRPILLEGKKAPDQFPVIENGVKYMVSLDQYLSTGLFLDQRPQRAWLKANCGPQTMVLNCFAHTGAYSVAAAAAGASTVNIDLSKKWLDKFPDHLRENGIDFDEKHDCIFGDCFDWLNRLAKRGEKYDIVILDPPSYSVGGQKKKHWSVAKDADQLVMIASKLVKQGGYLWTTTNNASLNSIKFGKMCHKGLTDAGVASFKLDRVQPMPYDYQSIGPAPVKNFVWKL